MLDWQSSIYIILQLCRLSLQAIFHGGLFFMGAFFHGGLFFMGNKTNVFLHCKFIGVQVQVHTTFSSKNMKILKIFYGVIWGEISKYLILYFSIISKISNQLTLRNSELKFYLLFIDQTFDELFVSCNTDINKNIFMLQCSIIKSCSVSKLYKVKSIINTLSTTSPCIGSVRMFI